MLAVTELLIMEGAPLDAKNNEKKTAFAIALESENITILENLA